MDLDITPFTGSSEDIIEQVEEYISGVEEEFKDHKGMGSEECEYLGCGKILYHEPIGWRTLGYVPELRVYIAFLKAKELARDWSWSQGKKC